jgi:CubicO group peptidase (beta-lactamase class C family)
MMASEPIARSESFAVFIPELERLITEVMELWKVPGLAVAVVQNADVAFVRPYGLRDVEAGLKVTTDTQFQLMSAIASDRVTVRDLLCHQSCSRNSGMYSRTGFFQSMRRSFTKRAKPVAVNDRGLTGV